MISDSEAAPSLVNQGNAQYFILIVNLRRVAGVKRRVKVTQCSQEQQEELCDDKQLCNYVAHLIVTFHIITGYYMSRARLPCKSNPEKDMQVTKI